jgi:hypothetical protein
MADSSNKRSTRARRAATVQKAPVNQEGSSPPQRQESKKRKRATAAPEPVDEIDDLLTNPKGSLASVDMNASIR